MSEASGFSNSVMTYFLPLVQLVILFLQERREDEEMSLNEFGEWLTEHQFADIRSKLDSSVEMQSAIDDLLKQNHEQTLKRFYFIEQQLARISSQLDGFSQIAKLAKPHDALSNQAIRFLRSFENPKVSSLNLVSNSGAFEGIYAYMDSDKSSRKLEISESRFAVQDLHDVVDLGLLECEVSYEDYCIYVLTRPGSQFLKALGSQNAN